LINLEKSFWGYDDNSVKKKYALVAWSIVCKSKSQGDLILQVLEVDNHLVALDSIQDIEEGEVRNLVMVQDAHPISNIKKSMKLRFL
jgi:hypothetical protein